LNVIPLCRCTTLFVKKHICVDLSFINLYSLLPSKIKKNLENSIKKRYYKYVDAKHRKTLEAIFEKPERANIYWKDIESLLEALGADISEGNGSRVRVALHGVRAVFHRPHPQKETNKGAVKSVRRFLETAGVKP
jgi:hypothetical protein